MRVTQLVLESAKLDIPPAYMRRATGRLRPAKPDTRTLFCSVRICRHSESSALRRPTRTQAPADSRQQSPTHESFFAKLGFAVTRKAPRFAGLRVPRRRPTHGSKTRHTNLILLLSQDLPSLGKLRASPAYAYTGAGRLTAAKPDTRTFFG